MKYLLRTALLLCLVGATAFGLDQNQDIGLPNAIVVNKSDTTTYNPPIRKLFFSATAAQTITVGMAGNGASILYTYGTAGVYILPVSVIKVYSTGTTVTGIVGLREQSGAVSNPTPTATATFTPTATATFTPTPTATFTPTPTP